MSAIYNILHVIDKFSMDGVNPSSCAYLIRDWFRYADKSSFNIMTCGLKAREPAAEIYDREGMRSFFLGNGKYSPGNITALKALIQTEKISLVHLHGYSSANFGRIAARQMGIPNIVHEHAVLKILPHQYMADLVLRTKTDAAVAVSGAVKDFLHRGRHVALQKIRIIWNGIDLDFFRKSDSLVVQKLKREFSISDGETVLGTITRFRAEKGNEYLLRAMPAVIEKFPRLKLLIAGEGPLRENLEALHRELGLGDRVDFVGFRRDIADFMSLIDIVVIPSLSEGFGLVLAEAMAVGKPVVATRAGGMMEIATDGKDVILVRPGDPKSMADGILQLLEKPDLAKSLALTAFEGRDRFGIRSNVRKLEEMYFEMLESAKS
jgi:glycosyltransferase involved in cell wall biosynthesis